MRTCYLLEELSIKLILCHVRQFQTDQPVEEIRRRQSDEDMASTRSWNADPIEVPIGLVTRARAKKFQNALSGLIQGIWAQTSTWRPVDGDDSNL
jgi:hypothetical protein